MPEHTPPYFSPFDALLLSMDTQTLASLVIALCAVIEVMRHIPWTVIGSGLRRLISALGAAVRWSARSTARTLSFVADQLDAFGSAKNR